MPEGKKSLKETERTIQDIEGLEKQYHKSQGKTVSQRGWPQKLNVGKDEGVWGV